ncbi:helix-turn-helix domain-containing protein [Streptomyces xanthochromogenes]|uniref:helix-turn-helix domain-containing protein n=1 Tax=Streptomyces xanthochromogenes TaxID=67384 RepID=UPI003818CEAD
MLNLDSLVADAQLRLTYTSRTDASRYGRVRIRGLLILTGGEIEADQAAAAEAAGALVFLALGPRALTGATADRVDRLLRQLAKHRAAGVVLSAPSSRGYPAATRAMAERLGIPLLNTDAPDSAWGSVDTDIQHCRARDAEAQLDQLTGLLKRLPAQLADVTAVQRIADWLAVSLNGQVLVSEPERGVLAASPPTAAADLARAVLRQVSEPAVRAGAIGAGEHTRLVSLAPATGADTVLAVASPKPFEEPETTLVACAARLLGLVDQAQRENGTAAESARAARFAAFQLLMVGEPAKAQRVLAKLAPGLLDTNSARVFVIDCESVRQREQTALRCETAVSGRALVIRCPAMDTHVIIVESTHEEGTASACPARESCGVAAELENLISALDHHRMGGSSSHPLALVANAYEEAVTSLAVARHMRQRVALSPAHANVTQLLNPQAARRWADSVLEPIWNLPRAQRSLIEETVRVAVKFQHTAAAAILKIHRNTVGVRMRQVAELLHLDLSQPLNRVLVAMAFDIVDQYPGIDMAPVQEEQLSFVDLLHAPELQPWAAALLKPILDDRRDLQGTVQAWLEQCTRVEDAARTLGISEATVRSHLHAVEQLTGLDTSALAGVRDLTVALHVRTGRPGIRFEQCTAA